MDAEEHVPADARMIGVDRGGIHQLANTSADDLVTVHVYAPALMELNVYSTDVGSGGAATAALHPRRRPRLTPASRPRPKERP